MLYRSATLMVATNISNVGVLMAAMPQLCCSPKSSASLRPMSIFSPVRIVWLKADWRRRRGRVWTRQGTTAILIPSPEAENSMASAACCRGKVWLTMVSAGMRRFSISRKASSVWRRLALAAPTSVISP